MTAQRQITYSRRIGLTIAPVSRRHEGRWNGEMTSQLPGPRKKILIASTNADWAGAPIHVLTLVSALQASFDMFVVFGEEGPVRQALLAKGVPSRGDPHAPKQHQFYCGTSAAFWLSSRLPAACSRTSCMPIAARPA